MTRAVPLGLLVALIALGGGLPVQNTAAAGRWCPAETGYCAENAFFDLWQAHGALRILGYPIDHPRRAPNGQIIQFYERAVMAWHPQIPVAYQVPLTRLGALYVEGHPLIAQPPVPGSVGS